VRVASGKMSRSRTQNRDGFDSRASSFTRGRETISRSAGRVNAM